MPAIFLFDGGNYKRGTDDGRSRVPLTPSEAQMVFYDPEVPADTDNSIGTDVHMARYADMFCDLAVGDEIFVGLGPDVSMYRGLWMMGFGMVNGFTVDVDLVSVTDVHLDIEGGGDGTGVAPLAGTDTMPYDFTNAGCEATKDACDLMALWGGDLDDYRNPLAAQAIAYDPVFAAIGQAVYFRLTVTALGDLGASDVDTCSSCGGASYPSFQVGAIYDRLCIDKQRVSKYCNCPETLCGEGCEPAPVVPPTP